MSGNCLYIIVKILSVTFIISNEVSSSRILFLHPMASRSETILFKTLAKELASKGHEITYVSPFPVDNIPKNFDVIIPLGETEPFDAAKTILSRMEKKTGKISELFSFDMSFVFQNCHDVYKSTEFQKIYKKSYGLVHKFNAPFILISSMPASGPLVTATGFYQPSSFVPLPFFELSHNMNFWERFQNTFFTHLFSLMNALFVQGQYTEVYRQYLGQNYPELKDIEKNVSLILSNSHFSINFPRPFLPDIIEVGGLHCKDAKPLPKDLNEFLSGSKDGFIYFSLGSLIKGTSLPEKIRKTFINVFSKLKQNVLWKWETEKMEDLPSNVRLGKWLPQQDILGHPNIKIFITHGGLLSTQEAVYFGVPVLGLPVFVDQESNMKKSSDQGFGITLDISDLNEEKLENAIQQILSNSKYTNQVKMTSKIFRDQPEPPLQRAVYWIEYILRNNGAEHLRSSARNLTFIQYHSLDTISFLFTCFVLILSTAIIACKFLVRKLTGKRKDTLQNVQKKRN